MRGNRPLARKRKPRRYEPDGTTLSYAVQSDGELHGPPPVNAYPIPGSPYPERLPEERARLAQHMYRHPHSPEGLTTIQSLTATRRPSKGAPHGDKQQAPD